MHFAAKQDLCKRMPRIALERACKLTSLYMMKRAGELVDHDGKRMLRRGSFSRGVVVYVIDEFGSSLSRLLGLGNKDVDSFSSLRCRR